MKTCWPRGRDLDYGGEGEDMTNELAVCEEDAVLCDLKDVPSATCCWVSIWPPVTDSEGPHKHLWRQCPHNKQEWLTSTKDNVSGFYDFCLSVLMFHCCTSVNVKSWWYSPYYTRAHLFNSELGPVLGLELGPITWRFPLCHCHRCSSWAVSGSPQISLTASTRSTTERCDSCTSTSSAFVHVSLNYLFFLACVKMHQPGVNTLLL